ncbi:MAG: sulfotransferase [Acidimicrobiales bacterium]|nr:sulfotransferase [Acidimicrobiales bacterium]
MVVRYRNLVFDSERWSGFAFRPDDIVICTPPKCGTTWMQMLCALLVFDATEFDRPLAHISPWLDMNTRSLVDVIAELEAQTHRRFIKTHTPLDGLPWHDDVTYVCVGRDPRDASLSWAHHMSNLDLDAFIALRAEAVGLDDLAELGPPPPEPPADPVDRFWQWATEPSTSTPTLAGMLAQLTTFWDNRDRSNVSLYHYADLSIDLPGQMRRLADSLSIDVSDARLDELATAAAFDNMKLRAQDLAPNSDQGLWRSTEDFFNRGSSGSWRDLLDDADLLRYDQIVAALVGPDLAEWAHHGWLGAGRQPTSPPPR